MHNNKCLAKFCYCHVGGVWYLAYNKTSQAKVCEEEMGLCSCVIMYDVALCCNTI